MMRRLIVALAAVSALGISFCPTEASARRTRAVVADGVPSWDLTKSCRAAASIAHGQTSSDRLETCLASEQRTREELDKNWSTFPAADRIACVKSLTFSPTYTELATCLEMRRDLKKSRDAKSADTNPPTVGLAVDNTGQLYLSPTGAGRRDGSNWENAATLPQLPLLLGRIGPGGHVLLRADAGPYKVSQSIDLRKGGAPQRPLTLMGVDGAGKPMKGLIVGTRAEPYSPTGTPGSELFRLLSGADHIRFMHLSFRNHGNGCLRIAADIRDLTVEEVDAHNVRRFIENTASGNR